MAPAALIGGGLGGRLSTLLPANRFRWVVVTLTARASPWQCGRRGGPHDPGQTPTSSYKGDGGMAGAGEGSGADSGTRGLV